MDSLPSKARGCHRTGFKERCFDLVTRDECKCERWVHLQGMDRNNGLPFDRWGCIDDWGPTLQIEGNQMARETGAAVESLRNEVDKAHQEQMAIQSRELINHLNTRLVPQSEDRRNNTINFIEGGKDHD